MIYHLVRTVPPTSTNTEAVLSVTQWYEHRPDDTGISPLTFTSRIKSRLPFAGIIRRLPYSTGFQDKG